MDSYDDEQLRRIFAEAGPPVRPPLWYRLIAFVRPLPRGEASYADRRSFGERLIGVLRKLT